MPRHNRLASFQDSILRATRCAVRGTSHRAALALMALAIAGTVTGAAGRKYVNREYGFSMEVPEHWVSESRKIESGTALIFSGPKGSAEYFATINLQVVIRRPIDTIEERANQLEKQWKTAPAYRMISRATGTLGGQPAIRMVVEYQQPGGTERFRQEQVVAERGLYFYLVGYTASPDLYDKAYGAMQQALATFEFLPQ